MKTKIVVPKNYDYVGVYLTDKCHLRCSYCITKHHNSSYGKESLKPLSPYEWIEGLNRLELPENIPVTLQGGDPFLYKGIWEILEHLNHKIDILTALPPFLTRKHFLKLSHLDWNKRSAPYPTIRVSYHKNQNDYKDLIHRIADLNDILSIGLFYLEYPDNGNEVLEIRKYADKYNVELRKKEFLGKWNNEIYGNFKYKDAACGTSLGIKVLCKNTVVPIAPDGTIYRCHSDLYFNRQNLALGNISDNDFSFPNNYLLCENYGLCSECDIKIKNNHNQQFGYTSVDIKIQTENCKVAALSNI